MRTTFDWLLHIEEKAAVIYEHVAKNDNLGQTYQRYIEELAREELTHKSLLEKAMKEWQTSPLLENEVLVDDSAAGEVEEALEQVARVSQQESISPPILFDALVTAEWSEWNNIFVYIMKRLAKEGLQGEKITSLIERHKLCIIDFVEKDLVLAGVGEKLRELDKIWKTRILVVEDSEALRMLMFRVLGRMGEVETAEDGQIALELCREKHFDAIVSDIDMPRLDGFEFFKRLCEEHGEESKERFLFVTGAIDQQKKEEIELVGVQIMLKPFNISDLKRIVSRLIK